MQDKILFSYIIKENDILGEIILIVPHNATSFSYLDLPPLFSNRGLKKILS